MDNFIIKKSTSKKKEEEEGINVYTDGACVNNGKPYARAGYGVYFGKDDPRNVSESYKGLQTNNVAELLAIIKALTILKENILNGEVVNIYSDSRYAIRCCTTYGKKCHKNNWINPNQKNKPIPNLEIVQVAYIFSKDYKNINFKHIRAHTGLQDEHSIGNENADRLANESIGINYNKMSKGKKGGKKRIYLKVPYDEKDEAKKMGARWDMNKKKWYYEEGNKHAVQLMGRWAGVY
jgi:ribonuclease HI